MIESPALPDLSQLPSVATDRRAAIEALRSVRSSARESLADDHRGGVPAHVLVRRHAEVVDRLVELAWCRHGLEDGERTALVAVGGYGRAELHPGSDVDILLLLTRRPDERYREGIRGFITLLWDIGLEIGHSVRTVRECVSEAKRDPTIATALMESRLVRGAQALFDKMRERTGPPRVWSSRAFFEAKRAEQIERHHRFHDAAYNLEPNVKEGPGGLRDIQTIGWVAKRHFGAETLGELIAHEFLTHPELEILTEGQNFLWDVRYALHSLTGRQEDRLIFDHQRRLAEQFGYADDDHSLGVEKFMKHYYREIMELSRLNEMLLELFEEAILLADEKRRVVPVNRRFRAVNGFLEAAHKNTFKRYPFALLELFLILQQMPELKGVRASTIRMVRDHRYLIDDQFRDDIRARSLFLEILKQPRGITHELRRMHRYGVLSEYLPVFGSVVGQMQYDLFHVYTVDEHSLFVLSNLRGFAVPGRSREFPLCSKLFNRLPKPVLLYIAGLFHDIAKGRGEDHSELGAHFALEFCRHHGLGHYDSNVVSWLVKHHLLMSVTAQRRDISDPDVINEFAGIVGDRTHLNYLYLLTVADIRGTDPKLWNDWKATLLHDLYVATERALRRGLENPIDRIELIEETQGQASKRLQEPGSADVERARALWRTLGDDYFLRYTPEEIAWHAQAILAVDIVDLPLVLVGEGRGGTDVFLYAPDQKYLFAAMTSILGRLGLNILDARIITADNGMSLDSFVISELNPTPMSGRERTDEIRSALRAAIATPTAARGNAKGRSRKRRLEHFDIPTEVNFGNDGAGNLSLIEVISGDRPGLLGRIGWALADCEVRLHNAKIATYGERVEDVFFVTDTHNRRLDEERLASIRASIVEALNDAGSGFSRGQIP